MWSLKKKAVHWGWWFLRLAKSILPKGRRSPLDFQEFAEKTLHRGYKPNHGGRATTKEFRRGNRISCTCKMAFFAILEAFLHPGSCYHTYVSQDGENISPFPSPAKSANCFKGKQGLSKETVRYLFLRCVCFSKTHWKLFQLFFLIKFCLQDIIISYTLDLKEFPQLSFFLILSLFFYLPPPPR